MSHISQPTSAQQLDPVWPSTGQPITWATSWPRGHGLHGEDAYAYVAVTSEHVHFFESNKNLDAKVHQALERGSATGLHDLARLASGKGKTKSIKRSEITEIGVLGKLGTLQVQTADKTIAVGGIASSEWANAIAERLSGRLLPQAEPKQRATPVMSAPLLRQVATLPATVAFFASVVVALKFLLLWDTPNTRNQRGEGLMRAVLDPLDAPVVILLAAIVTLITVSLTASRLRNERFWRA